MKATSTAINCMNPELTEAYAEKIGKKLLGGEIIELIGDLGAGKTTFVRGLARGIGSQDRVASPTFTIKKIYTSTRLTLHHFDFYRLQNPGLIQYELADVMNDDLQVIVLEWADVIRNVLPKERLTISFETDGELSRTLLLTIPDQLGYILS
ncbi:MAG: hypothetical protein NVSMB46_02680 [Candidatus Saccharimonadales bacterium]